MAFDLNDLGYEKDSKERMPWEHYTEAYQKADPEEISRRLNLPYDETRKVLTVYFLGSTYEISWPDFQVSHLDDSVGYYPLEEMIYAKILVIRYLLEAVDSTPSGTYKTYREMPWGEVYLRQFDGRCIKRLAFSYGNRLEQFEKTMERMQARKTKFGDCSYEVELVKNYFVQFILWEGDEEFPPSSQILFSDNFPTSFSAEDMAVVGDVTIGTMKEIGKIL